MLALQSPVQLNAYNSGAAKIPDGRTQSAMGNQNIDNTQAEDFLSNYLRGLWSDALWAKRPHEQAMFEAMRQRKGDYSAAQIQDLQAVGGSEIFLKLTETKCRAARAWINDIITNSGARPWALDPTPVPQMPVDAKERMAQAAQSLMAEGMSPEEIMQIMQETGVEEEIMSGIRQEAKDKAEKMSDTVDDQLIEGGYWDELTEVTDDYVTFQACFMEGPRTEIKKRLTWKNGKATVVDEPIVVYRRKSPFDVYPSPAATSVQTGYLFIHERYTQHDLYNMRGQAGVDDDKLNWIISEYGQGGLSGWIDMIQDTRREYLEGRYYQRFAKERTIDALRYMGKVQAKILAQWGVEGFENRTEDLEPVEIEAILIKNYVVKVKVNSSPLGRRPIAAANILPIPGSFWGHTLPGLMSDLQDIINFAIRSLAENMSMASGPMVAVDESQLARGENVDYLHAWKVFHLNTEDSGTTSGKLPIEFFQPSMNAEQLQRVVDWASIYADNVTGIPAYIGGNEQGAQSGAAGTASGLSMLMSASAKGMREMLAQMGKMVKGQIEELFTYNMLYHPDQSIKGDCQVRTAGFLAALQKETTMMRRQEFLAATNNPVDLQLTGPEGRRKVLREIATMLDMDPDEVVPDTTKVLGAGQPMDPMMGPQGAPTGQQPGEGARTSDGMAS